MAKEIGTNDLLETWGSTGAVVTPSIGKIAGGWQFEEQPPHEYMNWVHNHLGQAINYMMRSGVPAWNDDTEYLTNDWVSFDGRLWIAAANSQGSTPAGANANWAAVPFASELATVASDLDAVEGRVTAVEDELPTFLTKADNLASVDDAATARTNLGAQAQSAKLDAAALLSGDVVGTTDTQTLSGKTLTDPVINGTVTGTGIPAVVRDLAVGTVSQSGGVPTGAIIERGSNANGQFVKFADGTMICFHRINLGSRTSTGAGTLADPYRTLTFNWTFPAVFSSAPRINAVHEVDSTVASARQGSISFTSVSTTLLENLQAGFFSSNTTSVTIFANATAVGRWF